MAKTRSPNYPAINLQEALDAVSKIWHAEARSKMDQKAAALHMGHSSLNGRALVKLSALKKFGLLDGDGDQLQVTQLATNINADDPGSKHRQAAIRQAAMNPPLYQQIAKHFGGNIPSQANLRFFLIKQNFGDGAATMAAQNYLETMELVTREGGGYNPSEVNLTSEGTMTVERQVMDELDGHAQGKPAPQATPSEQDQFAMPGGVVSVRWPQEITPEVYDELEAWLKLALMKAKRLKRAAE